MIFLEPRARSDIEKKTCQKKKVRITEGMAQQFHGKKRFALCPKDRQGRVYTRTFGGTVTTLAASTHYKPKEIV